MTTSDGRRNYVSARTRDEVSRKLRARLDEIEKGLPILSARLTLREYALRWLAASATTVRPKTAEIDHVVVHRHLLPALGHLTLARLGPEHVERMIADKLKAGKAPQTVIHMRSTLRRILGQALRHGLVHRNAAALAKPPRLERAPVKFLDESQAALLVSKTSSERYGPLLVLAITTGLRAGEILGLRWCDVDLEERRLAVTGELQRVRTERAEREGHLRELTRLDYAKTSSSRRTLPLSDQAIEALRTQHARQRKERLQLGPEWRDSGLVFTTTIGTPFDQRNAWGALQRALKKADLPPMRFHDLRHTFATLSLRAGVELWVVSKMLGHSSIALTANTYGHLLPASEREAVDKLSALLARAQ